MPKIQNQTQLQMSVYMLPVTSLMPLSPHDSFTYQKMLQLIT